MLTGVEVGARGRELDPAAAVTVADIDRARLIEHVPALHGICDLPAVRRQFRAGSDFVVGRQLVCDTREHRAGPEVSYLLFHVIQELTVVLRDPDPQVRSAPFRDLHRFAAARRDHPDIRVSAAIRGEYDLVVRCPADLVNVLLVVGQLPLFSRLPVSDDDLLVSLGNKSAKPRDEPAIVRYRQRNPSCISERCPERMFHFEPLVGPIRGDAADVDKTVRSRFCKSKEEHASPVRLPPGEDRRVGEQTRTAPQRGCDVHGRNAPAGPIERKDAIHDLAGVE